MCKQLFAHAYFITVLRGQVTLGENHYSFVFCFTALCKQAEENIQKIIEKYFELQKDLKVNDPK